MSTLMLRLAAPLQSWGTESKFNFRTTNREPSKSGVIGILASSLGYSRDNDLKDLNKLRYGVRIEQEGNLLIDYQTAVGPFEQDGSEATTETYRYYLSDAVFLVGLEGERTHLEKLKYALTHPVFPLFLGRRSCPPMPPVVLGIRDCDLCQALRDEPWWASDWYKTKWKIRSKSTHEELFLRLHYEPAPGEPYTAIQRDLPISFDQSHRRYGYRGYTAMRVNIAPEELTSNDENINDEYLPKPNEMEEHDPMKELEE